MKRAAYIILALMLAAVTATCIVKFHDAYLIGKSLDESQAACDRVDRDVRKFNEYLIKKQEADEKEAKWKADQIARARK